jgi:[ribosomal protein S5]-alanine N-acetyltransferase
VTAVESVWPLPQPGWCLRRWQASDIARLAAIANDERIAAWMSDTWPAPYTEADARWWVQEGQLALGDNWCISHDGLAWGGCGSHRLAGFLRCNVEVGWWLSPDQWGQGIVSAAAQVLLRGSFEDPEVHRVFAPIHAGNTRSMRVALNAGLRLEAVQPQSAFKRGQVIDRHVFAAYRSDTAAAATGT